MGGTQWKVDGMGDGTDGRTDRWEISLSCCFSWTKKEDPDKKMLCANLFPFSRPSEQREERDRIGFKWSEFEFGRRVVSFLRFDREKRGSWDIGLLFSFFLSRSDGGGVSSCVKMSHAAAMGACLK